MMTLLSSSPLPPCLVLDPSLSRARSCPALSLVARMMKRPSFSSTLALTRRLSPPLWLYARDLTSKPKSQILHPTLRTGVVAIDVVACALELVGSKYVFFCHKMFDGCCPDCVPGHHRYTSALFAVFYILFAVFYILFIAVFYILFIAVFYILFIAVFYILFIAVFYILFIAVFYILFIAVFCILVIAVFYV